MLDILGFAFEGHPHSGIDDARNIARILAQLIADGYSVYENEKLVFNSPIVTSDAQAAEVEVLQAAEAESVASLNGFDDMKELPSDDSCIVVTDSILDHKSVNGNNIGEPSSGSGRPVSAKEDYGDPLKCADLLERLSF